MDYQAITLNEEVSIPRIVSIHYFPYSKNFIYTGERHNFWELVYVDSGEVTIWDEDTQLILSRGEAFLHAPNHFHNIKANNRYSNTAIFAFDGYISFAHKLLAKPIKLSEYEKMLIKVILSEGETSFSEPLNLIELEKMNLRSNPPFGGLQLIKCSLESLLISMARDKYTVEVSSDSLSDTVNQIIQILRSNIGNNVSIESIASAISYSPTYTKSIFRKVMKTSIIQYFLEMKIAKAKEYIADDSYTFSEISDMLGFDSLAHFSRTFKTHTNMSPSDYKKSVKKGGIL